MINNIRKIFKYSILTIIMIVVSILLCINSTYAENLGLSFSYGINNVAKDGSEFPISYKIENRDSQKFEGTININVYETNTSVFVYSEDISIEPKSTITVNKTLSITDASNTIIVEIYNLLEELVTNERTNIDLSFYKDRLFVGAVTSDFYSLGYIDNVNFFDKPYSTKVVEIKQSDFDNNNKCLDLIDLLVISDADLNEYSEEFNNAIHEYAISGRPLLISLGGRNGTRSLPKFMMNNLVTSSTGRNGRTYFVLNDKTTVEEYSDGSSIQALKSDKILVSVMPFSLNSISTDRNNVKTFIGIVEKCFGEGWILKVVNKNNSLLNSTYYNISNLLNMVDRRTIPDIFILSTMLIVYLIILTLLIYVYLRNINKRQLYGRYALIFSVIYTVIMLAFGYSIMKKNTFLTYISIVNIDENTTSEKAFLNFRTSESGSYSIRTSANNKLLPIIKYSRDPIVSSNFLNLDTIKYTILKSVDDRVEVDVVNAKDFDSNVFRYENSSYLNDVYNVDCSFTRMNGEITGRITNNMSIGIKDASVLFYGKILKLGDIPANHSISLSRGRVINSAVGNNSMVSEIVASGVDNNVVNYYLDDNVLGYYNYGLLVGFIDNNGTIDINSSDIGDVYGKTLLVTKIDEITNLDNVDICSLKNPVENISGYYDNMNNSVSGESEVINKYKFDDEYEISELYFEGIDSYDHGDMTSNVPFYGEIYAYNLISNSYDLVEAGRIGASKIGNYLTADNMISIRFLPLSRDTLYRRISLPVMRAVAKK